MVPIEETMWRRRWLNALSEITSQSLKQALARLGDSIEDVPAVDPPSLRPTPANDNQLDFFVPALHDVPVKDGIGLMDIAVFRLSKKQTRKGDIIRYELPDATVEVAGGAHGMATIYDYDIVLMMISHLAEAMHRHRKGQAEMPSKTFRPHSSEVYKFCRAPYGSIPRTSIEAKSMVPFSSSTIVPAVPLPSSLVFQPSST